MTRDKKAADKSQNTGQRFTNKMRNSAGQVENVLEYREQCETCRTVGQRQRALLVQSMLEGKSHGIVPSFAQGIDGQVEDRGGTGQQEEDSIRRGNQGDICLAVGHVRGCSASVHHASVAPGVVGQGEDLLPGQRPDERNGRSGQCQQPEGSNRRGRYGDVKLGWLEGSI